MISQTEKPQGVSWPGGFPSILHRRLKQICLEEIVWKFDDKPSIICGKKSDRYDISYPC